MLASIVRNRVFGVGVTTGIVSAAALIGGMAGPAQAATVRNRPVINEVLVNPTSPSQAIETFNPTSSPQFICGVKVRSSGTTIGIGSSGCGSLASGAYGIIWVDPHKIAKTGDTLELLDSTYSVIDTVYVPPLPLDATYARKYDASTEWEIRTGSERSLKNSNGPMPADTTAPGMPTQVAPANGSTTSDTNPNLVWTEVTDDSVPVRYFYTYSQNSAVDSDGKLVASPGSSGNGMALDADRARISGSGLADGTYFWQVRACDWSSNCSAWSSPWSFTVDTLPPDPPTLVSPADGSITPTVPELTWTAGSPDSERYTIEMSEDPAFGAGVVSTTSTTAAFSPSAPLADGTWFWRVRAEDGAGQQSPFSAARSFVLDSVAPNTPTADPPAGTYAGTQSVTLSADDGTGSGIAAIYYTTDGSDPAVSTSRDRYVDGIRVDAATTLRAIAIDHAGNQSDVLEAAYLIQAQDEPPADDDPSDIRPADEDPPADGATDTKDQPSRPLAATGAARVGLLGAGLVALLAGVTLTVLRNRRVRPSRQ